MAGTVTRSLGRRAYSALAIPLTEPLPITKLGAVSHVIPEVEVSRLSTGLVVSSVNNLSPISKVSIFVEGGSRHETYANRGATHFLRSSSYLTTKGASSFRIVRGIGDVGGKLHVSSGREHMIYSVDCLTDKVETLMEYLVNVTTAQEFRIWELATVRARVRLEKALAFQSPQIGLVENLHNVAYKNALQNSIFCPADMVDRITPTMIQEFVQNHFTSGRIALVGIGVSHADLKQLGEQFLNVRGGRGSPIAQAKYRGGEVRQQTSGEYVHAAVVVESAPVGTVESKAFLLLQHVLGMGPNLPWGHSAGRLWHAVAKETAQSFAVSSLNFAYSDSGLFGIYSVCAPTAATKVIRAALAQVKAVADGNLTVADVARARALAASRMVMAVETRVGLLDELGSQAMATSSFRPPAHAAADLRNIKIADVVAVAKRFVTGKKSMAAFGDLSRTPCLDEL